ncbi:hypothetical protein DFH06DRAFT_1248151 [Mycena polygramma]|nr:hypothetical protein DFH06DRAFT_1248151 [Mycena polygramma]
MAANTPVQLCTTLPLALFWEKEAIATSLFTPDAVPLGRRDVVRLCTCAMLRQGHVKTPHPVPVPVSNAFWLYINTVRSKVLHTRETRSIAVLDDSPAASPLLHQPPSCSPILLMPSFRLSISGSRFVPVSVHRISSVPRSHPLPASPSYQHIHSIHHSRCPLCIRAR